MDLYNSSNDLTTPAVNKCISEIREEMREDGVPDPPAKFAFNVHEAVDGALLRKQTRSAHL
jgi:hypothetical protein